MHLSRQAFTFVIAFALFGFTDPLSLSASASGPGQRLDSAESGHPFLRHFPPREIQGGPQVLASVQDGDGLIYFAANRSIRIYDGARWQGLRLGTPRRLALGPDGRVWVGCDGDLGYLQRTASGFRFVSIRDQLPEAERPGGQIVGLERIAEDLFFVYGQQVIRVGASGPRAHRLEDFPIEATGHHLDRLYLYRQGLGPVPWTATEAPATEHPAPPPIDPSDRVRSLLSLGENGLLIGTTKGSVWRFADGAFTPFSPAAEARIGGRPVWQLERLRDGRIALGSRGAGLLWLDSDGALEGHLTEAEGLPGNDIYTLTEDASGTLWIGTSPGIVRLSRGPLDFYHGVGSPPESLLSLIRHRGTLYLGSVEGAYRLRPSEGPYPARFEAVDAQLSSVGSWASTPHGLLLASRQGVYRVEGLRAEPVSALGQAVHWDPELGMAITTHDDLLRLLLPETGPGGAVTWRAVDHPSLVPERVFEINPGRGDFWLVTMGTRTLYRLSFPEGGSGQPRIEPFETTAPWPRPLRVGGELRIVDRDRVLYYDEDRAELRPDTRFAIGAWRPPGVDRYELKSLASGEIWVGMRDRLIALELDAQGNYQPGERILGLPSALTFDMWADPEASNVLWLSTELGPARFETQRLEPATARPSIRFLPPLADGLGAPEIALSNPAASEFEPEEPVLEHSPEALRFEVSVPFYRAETLNRFRYRLVGFDETWSSWTRETFKEYTNLPGGRYRFEVEAEHAGRVLGASHFAFRALPPWYQTWWARLGYLLTVFGLALTYVRAQERKLDRERAISERERTASLRLRQLDDLKNEFIANSSHELRTPLFGIAGLAESLLDGAHGELPSGLRHTLGHLVSSSRRLSHLVDDLLDVSQLEHRDLKLDPKPVDVAALVDVVLALTRPGSTSPDLALSRSFEPDLPDVLADENRLQQILQKLIGNAAGRSPRGRIEVSAVRDADRVKLRVTDDGPSIPAERHDRVFEPFENPRSTGTGLGLQVCRQLVELHGGRLQLESSTDEGTTFVFDLPISESESSRPIEPWLGPADAPRAAASKDHPRAKSRTRQAPAAPIAETETPAAPGPALVEPAETPPQEAVTPRPARILVVDDEPINRLVCANFLALRDFDVREAVDGEDALRQVEAWKPDLILLDVMMPKLSGYQVCRYLRAEYSRQELPIIFLTARNQIEDMAAGYEVGANEYLTKPVGKRALLARVDTHLELLRASRELETMVEERTRQIRILRGLLPICASCKKIRDDDGYWSEMELFISEHSEAEFSHSICPTCYDRYYGDLTK